MPSDLRVYVHDYRRLWWRRVRAHLGRTAVNLALATTGLVSGLWLASTWTLSGTVSVGVVIGCVVVMMHVGSDVWNRVRRRRTGPLERADTPELIRLTVRGETAVVVPPYHRSDATAVGIAVVVAALLVYELNPLDAGPGSVAVSALMGAAAASALVRGATWLARPGLAMFTDRVEIRRGLGWYVVPWSAVAGAGEERGRLVVYVHQPDMVLRKGIVPRHPAYGVRARGFALPASVIAEAVERFRRDSTARGAIPSFGPRVVDDGTP